MQLRPCFLVVDTEHAGAISTRKLVLETAKYNVITAYSCAEAIEVLERFPRVHGVVINGMMRDAVLPDFCTALKALPAIKLIVVGTPNDDLLCCEPAAVVEGFAPAKLLAAMPALFPEQARYLHAHETNLEQKQV